MFSPRMNFLFMLVGPTTTPLLGGVARSAGVGSSQPIPTPKPSASAPPRRGLVHTRVS
jgi:hypothetical protein